MDNLNKIKDWVKENKLLIAILVVMFAIRLYYFWICRGQSFWFDEGGYMSLARSYAGGVNYDIGSMRLPGFPLMMSLFFITGLSNEVFMRFVALLIPSLLIIVLTYFTVREMYPDKRIALISTVIMGVLWEHLFYSNRFHTENMALLFQMIAMFILFYCYIHRKDLWVIKARYSLIWITFFSIVSVFFRPGNAIFIPPMICFILLLNQSWILKKKHLPYLAGIIIAASALLYYISRMPKTGLLYVIRFEEPLTLAPVWVFNGFYQSVLPTIPLAPSVFLYAFILGILVFAFTFYIYIPKLKGMKRNNEGYDEDLDFKSDIFNVLLICATLGFFIVITRSATYELRWFFPMVIGMFVFTAKGILVPLDYLGTLNIGLKDSKRVATILIIFIVCLGTFNQLAHADMIIKNKVTSYKEVKDSGLWMKQNSNPGDLILSASEPQHTYYAERKVYNLNWFGTEENFTNFINENHPKFLVLSIFEPHPTWIWNYPMTHNDTIVPLIGYSIDGKQTALAIYEVRPA